MANKMIIDASHPEETRVVVLRGNKVEEFDFESASKKPLRGNIYLAKVTRVEPSLQAAFVEYGGNRHGFLAFSEIHPDYYQIPHADRAALLAEEQYAHGDEEDEEPAKRSSRRHRRGSERRRTRGDEKISEAAPQTEMDEEGDFDADFQHGAEPAFEGASDEAASLTHEATQENTAAPVRAPDENALHEMAEAPRSTEEPQPHADAGIEVAPAAQVVEEVAPVVADEAKAQVEPEVDHTLAVDSEGFAVVEEHDEDENDQEFGENGHAEAIEARRDVSPDEAGDDGAHEHEGEEDEIVEQLGGDALDETPRRAPRLRRQYKIQEVIKRRQVLLIQVVKEERGNKGAALTTYLSLAGRYSVLMPNTARGGGISRKITDAGDRKRLKEIAVELEVPEGMGVILRTAGASRTKPEVKRDFEYLLRMWETVRELTLNSTAPSLVYEEGSLIKRAIRDLYNKDIDDVIVAGEEGYREARDFMRLLMPSHVKCVQPYRDPQPIFAKWGAESQLDALFNNQVTLKSGGYIVINQTEALVAIDVNSGRSTREHNIEDTALRTNLEAADEVARQLRLRDLAGLIVVDFIDMEESRNNRSVERRLKDALKDDRARIQVGRISHFGLLEMSRQRIRTGVLEGSSIICPHCAGAGTVRSTASVAVHVMRVLEDALIKNAAHNITVRTRTDIALYVLNQKRWHLRALEERFGVAITVAADDTLTGSNYHALERGEPAQGPANDRDRSRRPDPRLPEPEIEDVEETEIEETESEAVAEAGVEANEGDSENKRRRRRRRGRGRGGDREAGLLDANAPQPSDDGLASIVEIDGELSPATSEAENDEGAPRAEGARRGRWRRRGFGGRNREENAEPQGDWRASEANPTAGEGDNGVIASTGGAPADLFFQPSAPFEATAFAAPGHDGEATSTQESPKSEIHAPGVSHADAATSAATAADFAEATIAADEPAPANRAEPSVETSSAREPAPQQPELPVITTADPSQPKRSGWWARAKANLTGA